MAKKRAAVGPSRLGSYISGMEEARAGHRYVGLLQDYQDLAKETEANKTGLLKAKQKKWKLVAEVKFLRRKLKSFMAGDSLKMSQRLEKLPYIPALSPAMHSSGLPSKTLQEARNKKVTDAIDLNQVYSYRPAPRSARYVQMHNSSLPSKSNPEDRNHKVTEAVSQGRRSTALLDLNQVSYRTAPPSARYTQIPNTSLPSKARIEDRKHEVTVAATRESRDTNTLFDLNQAHMYTDMPRCNPKLQSSALPTRHMHNWGLPIKAHPEDRNLKVKEAASQGTTALLDLNQYVEEFEEQEPYRIDNLKSFSVGSSVATINDHTLFWRNVNEPKQVSRRKIPLQDQLPLRV